MTVLTCENLNIRYDAGMVVSNVSFSLEAGDYLCIIGENGSGKSTLLKGILGLLKLHSGTAVLNVTAGYLPQQKAAQNDFPADVYEVVISGCLKRLFYSKRDRLKVREYMRLLGIEHIGKTAFSELSGGQRQRTLLARGLCASDKLLALDEPVTGLDPAGVSEMYALLSRLNKNNNMTVIMISHDLNSALQHANKILYIKNTVRFFGSTDEFIKTEACQKMIGGCDCDV